MSMSIRTDKPAPTASSISLLSVHVLVYTHIPPCCTIDHGSDRKEVVLKWTVEK